MMRGTIWLERTDLQDPEQSINPNIGRAVLEHEVQTAEEFKQQVINAYAREGVTVVSFGPIGKPWK